MITSFGSLQSLPRSFTGLILRFYFLSVKIEMGSLRMFFNRTFRNSSSPSAAELNAGIGQAEKLCFCWVLCLTKPVVYQMWHFGSIYVNSQTHDDKRIKAPIQGRIKPEKRKQGTKTNNKTADQKLF